MRRESPILNAAGWPVVSLAEIATKIGSGATPRGGADTYLPTRQRFRLVRSQDVFDRRFDYEGLAFITDEQAAGLKGVVLQPGDILLNITGDGITFGRSCMVPSDAHPACVNQHVSIIRVDPRRADPGYVLSFLTHPEVKPYIESFNAGGSRRAITKGHIESFRLPLPPLAEQQAIAHILGTLDDKIELNRETNETLEAMARALFKSWFVDFDPVRAKAEGRQPNGMDAETAKLFPSEFEESELGEIPKGWTVGETRDMCAKVENGGTPKRGVPEFWAPPTVPWLTSGEVRQPYVVKTENRISDEGLQRSSAKMWPAGTTIVAMYGATAGELTLSAIPLSTNQACCGLIPRDHYRSFVYFNLRNSQAHVASLARGSAQQNLSQSLIAGHKLVVPPGDMARAFEGNCAALVDRSIANERENASIAELRDALLPRLLSGELSVAGAEHVLEAQA